MEQILANLPPQVNSSGSSPVRIPVFYILLRQTSGATSHSSYDVEQSINVVNNHFNGLFEFYVCGKAQIDDDQFNAMDLNASSSDVTDLHHIVNTNYPVAKECVKIFFCDLIEWNGTFPGGFTQPRIDYGMDAAVYCQGEAEATLSHELGHYFGLPHTFANPDIQYVHDIDHPVTINGVEYTCKHTGDGFCDTPADLKGVCLENTTCTLVTCSVSDPLGVPYNPDPTNLMSYYTECAFRFSLEQQERMKTIYFLHPNYEELRIINPACALKTGHIEQSCIKDMHSFPEPLVDLDVTVRQSPALCNTFTNGGGRYQFNPCNWVDGKRDILPDLDYSNPDNGVTTYDLVLLQKHILGLELLTNPFQIIAADANNSGSVTTFDGVIMRRVILGIASNFPDNRSWRYVSKLYLGNPGFYSQLDDGNPFDAQILDPFLNNILRGYRCSTPNPSDPQPAIPNNCTWMDHVSVSTTAPEAQLENTWSFVGIKVGDLNCNVELPAISEGSEESFFTSTTGLPIPMGSGSFKKIQVIAQSAQEVAGWQLGASFSADSLELLSFLPGNVATTFDADNFYYSDGGGTESGISKLNALWFTQDGTEKEINNKVLFEFIVKANAPIPALESFLHLNAGGVTPLKFYNNAGEQVPVSLQLNALNFAEARNFQTPVIENQLSNVSVAPVPFEDAIAVDFSLAQEAAVSLNYIMLMAACCHPATRDWPMERRK